MRVQRGLRGVVTVEVQVARGLQMSFRHISCGLQLEVEVD